MTTLARRQATIIPVLGGGTLIAVAVLVAAGAVYSPWLTAGAVAGAFLMFATLARPLWVLGLMLVLGPIDLSFITGGFKALEAVPGGLDMNGIRLVGITISLLSIAAVDPAVLREAFGRYGRWYAVFLAYGAMSLVMSDSLINGLRLLLKLAYPFLLFIAIVGVVRSRAELERLGDWVVGGAALIAFVINPLFALAGGAVITVEGRLRIPGVGVHENPFSFYMLMMILIAFTRYSTRRQFRYLILCAGLGAWMMATLTRITLLAAIAGFAGIALYGLLARRDWRTAGYAMVAALLIAVPLTPVVLERTFGFVPSIPELFALFRDPVHLFNTMNWQGREIYWAAVLAQFAASPIVGAGFGSSTALILANFPPEWGMVVHNEYIRMLAEGGIVGLLLLIIALAFWGAGAVRAGRTVDDPLVREFATPALAGLLAYAVISITDNAFDYYAPFTQYIGFTAAAAVAAAGLGGRVEDAGDVEANPTGSEIPHTSGTGVHA